MPEDPAPNPIPAVETPPAVAPAPVPGTPPETPPVPELHPDVKAAIGMAVTETKQELEAAFATQRGELQQQLNDLEQKNQYLQGRADGAGGNGEDAFAPKNRRELHLLASGYNEASSMAQVILQNPESYDPATVARAKRVEGTYTSLEARQPAWQSRFQDEERHDAKRQEDFRWMSRDLKISTGSQEEKIAKALHADGWTDQQVRTYLGQKRADLNEAAGGQKAAEAAAAQAAANQIEPGTPGAEPRGLTDPDQRYKTDEEAAAADYVAAKPGGVMDFLAAPGGDEKVFQTR